MLASCFVKVLCVGINSLWQICSRGEGGSWKPKQMMFWKMCLFAQISKNGHKENRRIWSLFPTQCLVSAFVLSCLWDFQAEVLPCPVTVSVKPVTLARHTHDHRMYQSLSKACEKETEERSGVGEVGQQVKRRSFELEDKREASLLQNQVNRTSQGLRIVVLQRVCLISILVRWTESQQKTWQDYNIAILERSQICAPTQNVLS